MLIASESDEHGVGFACQCISRVDHKDSSHLLHQSGKQNVCFAMGLSLQLLHIRVYCWVIGVLTIGITEGILLCMEDVSSAGKVSSLIEFAHSFKFLWSLHGLIRRASTTGRQ